MRHGSSLDTDQQADREVDVALRLASIERIGHVHGPGAGYLPGRNMFDNGAFNVCQRATSLAGVNTVSGVRVSDRWYMSLSGGPVWTVSNLLDAPPGTGLTHCQEWLCTTASASPAAGEYSIQRQAIEGNQLQSLMWGTAYARPLVLPVWVKSNKIGVYNVVALHSATGLQYSLPYTINVAGVWEFKTLIFPPLTTATIPTGTGPELYVQFWLNAGSTYMGGATRNTWAAAAVNTQAAVGQVNLAATVGNYWRMTGAQAEAGSTPTPFELLRYDDDLRRCQRCYEEVGFVLHASSSVEGIPGKAANLYQSGYWKVTKRASPTVTILSVDGGTGATMLPFNGGHGELTGFYQNTQHSADTNALIAGECDI